MKRQLKANLFTKRDKVRSLEYEIEITNEPTISLISVQQTHSDTEAACLGYLRALFSCDKKRRVSIQDMFSTPILI